MDKISALKERIVAQEAKVAAQEERVAELRLLGRLNVASAAQDTLSDMRQAADLLRDRLQIMQEAGTRR